jgi:exosortase/archaeosortase family protein
LQSSGYPRSSLALLLTTLLAGHRLLTSPWKKALLVLAAVPVAVIKNAVRIVTLTLLAAHVDPGFLTGQLHHEGRIVFYLLALAILAPVLTILRRSELKRALHKPLEERSVRTPDLNSAAEFGELS